ncbi:MAG: 7-carboxy-7-deazaguanine synthase [Deltaproteobacteria bacterium]|nr:MAG: 7-carboxy-7-deazaguanine synthase [Deltaproteobacteria bacterium]
MMLKINEIFYSIQGESTFAGCPCIFIRLTGCNLRCKYCDTKYAYEEGDDIFLDSILATVKRFDCNMVEVTGGEPLIQDETPDLISALIKNGYTVLLETNGSHDISSVDKRCIRIVDIKCPSSGMDNKNYWKNLDYLTANDQLKFVIAHRQDYLYAKKILDHSAIKKRRKLFINFSTVFNKMELKELATWILEDHLQVRLHMQLHKYIWGENTRGV